MRNRGIIIFLIAMFIYPTNVKAALQSNGGTPAVYNVNTWIGAIRYMQALGGTLGRTDTINANLTSSSKELDIHMLKNTEYGAIAILSASAYGNPNPIASGQTTTGNSTGIQMNLNKEWVSGGTSSLDVENFKNASNRYKNIYTTSFVSKTGDAIVETAGWHTSNNPSIWFDTRLDASGLLRAFSDSIFTYYCRGIYYENREAHYEKTWASRAAIVVGTGI